MAKSKGKVSRFRQVAKNADQELEKRAAEDYKNRGSSGKYGSFFTDELPLKKWNPGEGDHVIDIIPFLAGKKHPKLKEDEVAYCVDLYAHRAVGPNEDWVICHARTYGQPCPICKHQAVMRKQGTFSDKEINELNPSRRVIYNVMVLDSAKDEDEGVQLWEVSHFLFAKYLTALARNKRTGGFIPFSSAEAGKTIEFTKEGKMMNTAYSGIMFSDRDEIPDDILDQAISIDDYIDLKTYEEIEEMFFGGDVAEEKEEIEEEEPEPTTSKKRKRPPKAPEDDEPEEEFEEEEEPEEEFEEDDEPEDDEPEDDEPEDDEPEDDEPEEKPKRRLRKRSVVKEDEGPEAMEEPEDKPKLRRRNKKDSSEETPKRRTRTRIRT